MDVCCLKRKQQWWYIDCSRHKENWENILEIRYSDFQPTTILGFSPQKSHLFNCYFFTFSIFLKLHWQTALQLLKAKQCNQYQQLVKYIPLLQLPEIKMIHVLTYVWVLNRSEVHTLSPSNPITLLQTFILGSNGLFAIMTSPLKRENFKKCIIQGGLFQ